MLHGVHLTTSNFWRNVGWPYVVVFVALLLIGLALWIAKFPDTLSAGQFSLGYLSAGVFSAGVFSTGTFAVGVFAAGTFAIGVFAAGVFAIGLFSVGVFSIGLWSVGLFALGVWVRSQKSLKNSKTQGDK
ncbi:MAG: hypothetical protein JRN20_12010 [Nitrososphaerota archaeon]|nr:hypothetical protein [Nitrososphaerota archaeon]